MVMSKNGLERYGGYKNGRRVWTETNMFLLVNMISKKME